MIYLDYAATTPMSPTALDAYQRAAERFFGNASSLHDTGSEAERALEGARKMISSLLNIPARGLYFTGSGSEASFLSLTALAKAHQHKGRHLITTEVEHSSVRNTFLWLEREGFEITWLSVDSTGRIDPDQVTSALREDTILVSVQFVNSEIGSIHPINTIGDLLSEHQALFHSDLVQGFGKCDIDPAQYGLDSFSISAHKVQGPKGIGAAWVDPSLAWAPFIPETIHEHGFRPGTVDVPAAASFAVAAKTMVSQLQENRHHVEQLKQTLIDELGLRLQGIVTAEGDINHCSPYIIGLSIQGMEGQFAMLELSQKGVAVSTGSACQVNQQKPSATLLSMGRDPEEAKQFIRLSLSAETTREEVLQAASILSDVVKKHHAKVRL